VRVAWRLALPYLLALLLAGGVGEALGHSPIEAAWKARLALLGHPRGGIWQDDDRLGWRHRPRASGSESKWLAYDVRYTTDAEGHRVTAGSYDLPKLVFVGGSFTFGHGVEDDEPFAARLARAFPDHKVINAGVNGWGTGQALLAVEALLAQHDDVELVVYGFIANHLHRNHRRRSWLEGIDRWGERRNVLFEAAEGELRARGLAGPEAALGDESPELARAEARVTRMLIERMFAACAHRSIPLRVVHLPDGTDFPVLERLAPRVPEGVVHDLRADVGYEEIRFRYDFHPTAEGHRRLAERIRPLVAPLVPSRRVVRGPSSPAG
jgi:hypothetical protein